jgi:hypothetical protein
MVAAFGIFLALLFNRTKGHVATTMLAHFSFNTSIAVGGAVLGSVFIWTLAFIFSTVAIFSLAKLSAQPIQPLSPRDAGKRRSDLRLQRDDAAR